MVFRYSTDRRVLRDDPGVDGMDIYAEGKAGS
jgi:hypothetical protein